VKAIEYVYRLWIAGALQKVFQAEFLAELTIGWEYRPAHV